MADARQRARLKALDAYQILDTAPEQIYDDLVRLAAHVCGTPMAVLTLVDERRQWFKAAVGMPVRETDRSLSFCAYTIEGEGPFIVPDAGNDPRFAGNPLVTGEPGIQFYAGVPLASSSGARLGSLAVLDRVPREVTPEQLALLTALARQAMGLLEPRLQQQELRLTRRRLNDCQRVARLGSWELALPSGALHWSDEIYRIFGLAPDEFGATYEAFLAAVHPDDRERVEQGQRRILEAGGVLNLDHRIVLPDGSVRWVQELSELERDAAGRPVRQIGTVLDITDRKAAEAEKQKLVRDLGERIKELRALHEVSSLLRQEHLSVGAVLERVVVLLPPAMQYPEMAAARVEFGTEGRTAGKFRETPWLLEAGFTTSDGRAGRLQIVYLEERPAEDAVPFLVEERRLIDSLAEMLRVYFEQRAVAQVRQAGQREHERRHAALVALTRSPVWHGDDETAVLREITRTIASALDVARVSFWRYSEDRAAILCQDLFETVTQRHSSGQELRERDFPAYFQALTTSEIIAAEDARSDPRTREFTATYLDPLGIAAMLDAPVQVAGKPAGVLCLEHIGAPRAWTPGERSLAVAAGSLLALALAQSALARSESRLRTILESEPECVKIVSAEGQLIDMNAAGLRMIEADKRDAVIGQPVLKLIHPEDRVAFIGLHRRVCRGETGQLQFRIRSLRGGERWMETHSAPFREADGRISCVLSVTRDITERKQGEEALRTSEERFRELAENIGDIFYSYDPANKRLLYVNRVYERIWGRSIEHAYAYPTGYLEHIHPDDRPAAERAFERRLAGELTSVEFRIIRSDGGVRWIREEAVPVLDEQNRVKRIVGTMRDITDAKQGELALRDSEERYALAVRASQAALWDWDMSTNVIVYSPRYREMLDGYTREEFPDTLDAFYSKVHPDDLEAVKLAIQGHVERRLPTPDAVEFRLLTKRGEYRWFRASAQAEWDASGRPLRMVGSTVDIHERRLAEAKVREQAELLDKAQDAILVRDLEHRIQYWNKSAERLYGWPATEAVGRSVKELLYQDPAGFLAATAATLEKGEWVGELTQFNQAGRPLTVEGRWTLVRDGQGRPKSILAINTDISERKRIEQQLLRTQRMESLGTLAGGIAHDLNNVLAPILVSIELLRLDERDPERLTVLASLEDSARRGADLVRQVLSFARGIEGERVLTNLHHLARELQQIVRDTFPKNIEFRLESARDLWTVSADPTQMHQVMMNLCVNARDAMPEGGRLTLGLRNFEVDDIFAGMNPDARPGPYVIIKVEDTGTGIPANIQERIFDPFFTTKEFGKGTGLGLATVLTIVKSHGGFIHLYSEPGKGTKFKVYLPAGATPEAGERTEVEQTRLPRGYGELILVVDDEEGVRTVTRRTLERFGYRVMLAVHGAEAVALYAEQGAEIAVVLTDMAMPVMDGPATILALRALNPAVKIIGSSGHASGGSVAKATGAGVDHFVPKPYTAEMLLKVLAEVLARPV